MKLLLIDDKANNGWKQVLENTLPINNLLIDTALSYNEGSNKIQFPYDLIFLDVRLDEKDHNKNNKIEESSGYKLLRQIRKSFLSINFSTPIILFTASNKIWNIEVFKDFGADAYYIKEHPDFVFDVETSRQNLKNLQNNFETLIQEGVKRNRIWNSSSEIINILDSHYYFTEDKRYVNVKNRIIDKLKLGYTYLFKKEALFEKELLKTNNETLSFIIYWSILEEVVKGSTDISATWENNERKEEWRFRNKEYFIERETDSTFKVNYFYDYKNFKKQENTEITRDLADRRFGNIVSLSDQVYSLLYAYSTKGEFLELSEEFRELNKSRNEIDFIHSSIQNIFYRELISDKELERMSKMNEKILKFILSVFKLIEK